MIILLTGPTGTGKTDTSWALLQQYKQMIFLDCDWFASRVPFNWENNSDVESVFEALSQMIDFYCKKNMNIFVIPLTLQMAQRLDNFHHCFSKFNLPIHAFRLRCEEHELERRIRERDRVPWQKQEELNRMLEAQSDFDILFPDHKTFQLLDTTRLSEREVAIKIVSIINQKM